MEAEKTIPDPEQTDPGHLDVTQPQLPCEPVYDAKVDQVLDHRDRLQEVLKRLEGYVEGIPTEVLAQQAGLTEIRPRLVEVTRQIAVMRGDYLDGDPELRVEKRETQDEKAIRVLARIRELQASGVRGFRKLVSRETGWSPSYIRQLIDRAKRLEKASAPRGHSKGRA